MQWKRPKLTHIYSLFLSRVGVSNRSTSPALNLGLLPTHLPQYDWLANFFCLFRNTGIVRLFIQSSWICCCSEKRFYFTFLSHFCQVLQFICDLIRSRTSAISVIAAPLIFRVIIKPVTSSNIFIQMICCNKFDLKYMSKLFNIFIWITINITAVQMN